MSRRMNWTRVNQENDERYKRIGGAHRYGGIYATDKQKRYIKYLRDLCDERGLTHPLGDRPSHFKEGCKNEIRVLLRILDKNGYDRFGNYKNDKSGFLAYMERERNGDV